VPKIPGIPGPHWFFFFSFESRISSVEVTDDAITARLVDGRVISVPLAWSWRLSEATPAQRANWQLIGDGHGVHWPDVDEDISAEGMLSGIPARRPPDRRVAPGDSPLQPTSGVKHPAKSKSRSRAAGG
jgi:hypothetical protein